jgi:predicted ATPase
MAAPLFGRTAELAEIRRLVTEDGVRFLTLTGPGGIGKTRLAYVFAIDEAAQQEMSAYFVDLAVVDDPMHVPASIAQALRVQESGSEPLLSILRDVIARRAVLLVLDNFEHVMDAASFVADLVASAPQLTCLATSREPLHIRAERVFPVGPLSVPPRSTSDFATISRSPAVALFEDRGRACRPDFALTHDNAAVISEICRRLDGLPLAIELAAAEVGVLPPDTILARLEAHEPFVLGAARDLPVRHRTLTAAVAWSYDLLESAEQLVFRHCGIFTGAFGPVAVSALVGESCDAPRDLLGTLARLADKNLIQVAAPVVAEPRFRLLETIRSFANDALTESGELADARRRHALHFTELAEQAEQQLIGPAMAGALDQLEREYDNFRIVLSWSLDGGDLTVGLRLAGALYRFWMLRGHLGEARQWLDRALPCSLDVAAHVRAKALNAAGVVAGLQGDHAAAEALFRESFRLWEGVGDPVRMAAAIGNIGLVAQDGQ